MSDVEWHCVGSPVWSRRRLRLLLPLTGRNCRCGFPLDSSGHHRAACARAGVFGRRGFAVESVAARICRELESRVTTNGMVRDMDLVRPDVQDSRRLEVVVDGLSLIGGVQPAVDATVVSALHANGEARRKAARRDAVASEAARWRKKLMRSSSTFRRIQCTIQKKLFLLEKASEMTFLPTSLSNETRFKPKSQNWS